jgi:hypothetical protein
MGKGSRNAAMLAESRDRLKAQEELTMATIAGNMAVDMQGERSSKPSKKEKDKKDKLAAEPSKLKIGLSDLGGMAAAQGLNEGWSYLMRVAGRASVDGFVAENNDYLQASFPAIGGLLWYLIELYGVGKAPPGSFKMGGWKRRRCSGIWACRSSSRPFARGALRPSGSWNWPKPMRRRPLPTTR